MSSSRKRAAVAKANFRADHSQSLAVLAQHHAAIMQQFALAAAAKLSQIAGANVTTIPTAVASIVSDCGGLREAARNLDIDPAYLLRLGNGEKDNPSDEILQKLGLKRHVIYTTQENKHDQE